MTPIKGIVNLPDGKYSCHWGGYVVTMDEESTFLLHGKEQRVRLKFQSRGGIRTPNAAASLTVKNKQGWVYVAIAEKGTQP